MQAPAALFEQYRDILMCFCKIPVPPEKLPPCFRRRICLHLYPDPLRGIGQDTAFDKDISELKKLMEKSAGLKGKHPRQHLFYRKKPADAGLFL